MKIPRQLLFIIFCLLETFAFGQVQSLLSEKSLNLETDFAIEVFNSENGLPQNSVIDIIQTSDGFLWISTFNGLVKFDGIKFTVYNLQNSKGLSSNVILHLIETPDKKIWMIDDGGRLLSFNGSEFTLFEKTPSQARIRSFCLDANKNLLVSTSQNEIYRVEQNLLIFVTRNNQSELNSIERGPRNSILLLTSKGLFLFDNNILTPYDDLSGGAIYSTALDKDANIWVCSSIGIFKIINNEATRINIPDIDLKKAIKLYIDNRDRKWFYNENGLHLLDENEFTTIGEEQGLSSAQADVMYQDRENNIWIGTHNAGLNKLHYKTFRCFSQEDGLINDGVAPIIKRFDGSVWVGNNCGGINKMISGKIIKYELPENKCVWSLMEDEMGFVWIGTYGGGIYKYVEKNLVKHYDKTNGLFDEVVFSIVQDYNHTVWIGTDNGLYSVKNDSLTKFHADVIKSKINFILPDSSGKIWVATNNGLFEINKNKITNNIAVAGLPSNVIRTIYKDATGALWIGTSGAGLCRMKNGKIFWFKNISGIIDDEILCIARDGDGYFWMSSNHGMYSAKENELNNYADGKINSLHTFYFDRKDGLKSNEFNSGFQPNYFKEADDKIWFPTIKGIAILNKKRFSEDNFEPLVSIGNCKIDNVEAPFTEGLIIQRAAKLIELSFSAPKFHHPEKIFFQYQLEGYDAGWSMPSNKRTVAYYNLKPGAYTFKVRLWQDAAHEKTISFSIPLPFWMQRWFLITAYALAVIILGLLMYVRLRYVSKREERKTEINKNFAALELKALQAQMNPHFIFNCLNTIKYFITTGNLPAANKYLGKFSKLLRMFLEHSKSAAITLEEEINLLKLYIELEQMRFYEGFNFHLQVETDLDYRNFEIPGTLFQPFVENAINHGLINLKKKGNLTITFKTDKDYLVGIVDDDGIGRKAAMALRNSGDYNHISHGMKLIEERIKTINFIRNENIQMEIIDKEDETHEPSGTSVIIRIPLMKN